MERQGSNPLEKLYVGEQELREELLRSLEPYVRFSRESGGVITTPQFADLSKRAQVICYLLALHARSLVREGMPRGSTARDVARAINQALNGCRFRLSTLKSQGLLDYSSGEYSIAETAVLKCASELQKRKGAKDVAE